MLSDECGVQSGRPVAGAVLLSVERHVTDETAAVEREFRALPTRTAVDAEPAEFRTLGFVFGFQEPTPAVEVLSEGNLDVRLGRCEHGDRMRGFDLVVQRFARVRDAEGDAVGLVRLLGNLRGGDLVDLPSLALEVFGVGVGR